MLDERYDRNIGVWTEEFQEKLKGITIGIAGLGGSGGTLVDILARNGFGKFKIADSGVFDKTNIQRQINALEETIGKNKSVVTRERIRSINSAIQIAQYESGISLENINEFLDNCNFVHEVMDYSLPDLKIAFHRKAKEMGIITTTSAIIGTGVSVMVFHPQKMSFEEYFEYPGSIYLWNLPHDKLVGIDPDYLDRQFFLNRVKQGTVPTSADGAFLTGIVVAGIYKRILLGKEVAYAPEILRFDILDDKMYWRGVLDKNGKFR